MLSLQPVKPAFALYQVGTYVCATAGKEGRCVAARFADLFAVEGSKTKYRGTVMGGKRKG